MSGIDAPSPTIVTDPASNRLAEVAGLFLRLGFTDFWLILAGAAIGIVYFQLR
jgi:hypothetical protein